MEFLYNQQLSIKPPNILSDSKYREKIEYFIDALRLLAYCRSRFLSKNTVIPPNKKNQRIPLKKAKLI